MATTLQHVTARKASRRKDAALAAAFVGLILFIPVDAFAILVAAVTVASLLTATEAGYWFVCRRNLRRTQLTYSPPLRLSAALKTPSHLHAH